MRFGSRFLWKLYTGFTAIVVVMTVVLGTLITRTVQGHLVEQIRATLRSEAFLLHDVALPFVSHPADSTFQQRIWILGARTAVRLTVIQFDGTVVADSREEPGQMDNHRMRPEILEALASGAGTSTRFSRTIDQEMMYVAVPIETNGNTIGFARASLPLTTIDEHLGRVRSIVLLGGTIAVLLALLIGFLFARSFTRPIEEMTRAAEAITQGRYDQEISIDRSDEIGQLARALGSMTSKLREQIATITTDRNKTLAILAGMVEGVIAVDVDERIVHVNRAAESILGIATGESMHRRIWEATRIREVSAALSAVMHDRQVKIGEARIPGPQRDQVIQLIAAPLQDGDGRLDGAIVVLHDVSDLRELEAIRRDFIANMSHEIKTPLAAIRGLVETMIDDEKMPPDTHRRFLGKIRDQSSRLSSLVVDLLAISRLESDDGGLQFETVDLREPIDEAYRSQAPVADTKHIEISARVPEEPVIVNGDVESLRELADNLISNAIKYTASRGNVEIRLSLDGLSAVLEVEDSGIGIAPEDQGRIFERFYRVDKARSRQLGGTGLGLSIVKHVALAHGGNVSLRSTPGKGSTFRVQLPLAAAPSAKSL